MKTAILFKTHFWDDVVERNFLLCKRYGKGSDIYILLDAVSSSIIPPTYRDKENIILVPYSKIENLGLEAGMDEIRTGYWYNGDYHQNLFILMNPDYDYICTIENDVATHTSLNKIFKKMKLNSVDVIYYPQTQPNSHWSHLEGSLEYSDPNRYIHKGLFCVSFFSRRAAFHILHRRLEMSTYRRKNNIQGWPIGETVMVHEPLQAGMVAENLLDYCDHLNMYDWAPCYLTTEDNAVTGRTFVHPVTNLNEKFINSNFVQDYHSLFSESEVISGVSRERARNIADLEVYGRLFNSIHMQWSEDRWRPLLNDSAKILPQKAHNILKGKNWLRLKNIYWSGSEKIDQRLISPLPAWSKESACCLHSDIELKISLPSDRIDIFCITIGTENADFLEKIIIKTELHLNIKLEHRWRKMYFFSIAIPPDLTELCFSVKSGEAYFYSIRLTNNTGLISEWK